MPWEPLCVRCARLGPTCCHDREIYITPGDRQRIAGWCGHEGFFEFRAPESLEYAEADPGDPAWHRYVFRPDGTRRILKRTERRWCCFLRSHGCALPVEVRPLVCRLHPFVYTEQGLTGELASDCPRELLRPDEDLLDSLGMNEGQAEVWRQQLYAEIRLEEEATAWTSG